MVDRIGGVFGPAGVAGTPGVAAGIDRPARGEAPARAVESGRQFDLILQQQLATGGIDVPGVLDGAHRVRFSAHAQERLAQASVELGPRALARLEAAVDRAGQKGGKESLVLLDDLALVVSIKNRTVITAVDAGRMADNVFTRIDSVVIARGDDTAGSRETELPDALPIS